MRKRQGRQDIMMLYQVTVSGLDQSGLLVVALSKSFLCLLAEDLLIGKVRLSRSAKSIFAVESSLT